jgi:hypothetical protein
VVLMVLRTQVESVVTTPAVSSERLLA